jgi:hypothetical protein
MSLDLYIVCDVRNLIVIRDFSPASNQNAGGIRNDIVIVIARSTKQSTAEITGIPAVRYKDRRELVKNKKKNAVKE